MAFPNTNQSIRPSQALNQVREIESITNTWKSSFTDLSSFIASNESKMNQVLTNLLTNELKLIGVINTLESISKHHNSLDDYLDTLIIRQNAIVDALDTIEPKMLDKKGIQENSSTESIEQLYERSKKLEINKNEIDKMTENLNQKFEKAPITHPNTLSDQLSYSLFLHSELVIFT